jgi:hypothetical protein
MNFNKNTNNLQKVFDKPFALSIPNGNEITIDLHGEFEHNSVKIENLTRKDIPNPQVRKKDSSYNYATYKVFFPKDYYNPTEKVELVFTGEKKEEEKKSVLEPCLETGKNFTKKAFKIVAYTFITSFIFALILYLDNKHKDITGGVFNKIWSYVSVNSMIERATKIDNAIITNNHEFYDSEKAKESEKEIKEIVEDFSYKKKFWYVGNGKLIMRSLHRGAYPTGEGKEIDILEKLTYSEAVDVCENYGGRIPKKSELEKYLFFKKGLSADLVLPINSEHKEPEWTSDNVSWDDYKIFMKSSKKVPFQSEKVGADIVGDDGDTFVAFRCIIDV